MSSKGLFTELGRMADSFLGGGRGANEEPVAGSSRGTSVFDLTCQKCGAGLDLNLEKIQAFCPYCGAKLMIDVENLDRIIAEKEKTRREELKYEHERWERNLEESRRPGRIKASVVLAVIGLLMMVVGSFAGEATHDPNSSWYMISTLGIFPLLAIAFIWLISIKSK